jgi:hypothetical protein
MLERLPRAQLQSLLQSRLREQLGCRDAHVPVKWGEDDDGTNWTAELTGLPAPHHCQESIERFANELRAKYRLAKDRLSRADIAAILVNETLAELGPDFRTFPPPPRPVIEVLATGVNVPNWSAIPGGPVAMEYMQAFRRVLAKLQRRVDVGG